jgi:hypothetical protein
MSDYLWDKTGEPVEDVEQLENLLGTLKYRPRPLEIPADAMPEATAATTRPANIFSRPRPSDIFSRPRLALAASLLLTLLAGAWLVTRQSEPQKNQLAEARHGSSTSGSVKTETTAAADSHAAPRPAAPSDNVEQTKPGADKAFALAASAAKPRRAAHQSPAQRRKPSARVAEKEFAAREEVAARGGMRWQAEQPLTPEQRQATEQLMLALRLASAKLNYAQREMQEIGRAGK